MKKIYFTLVLVLFGCGDTPIKVGSEAERDEGSSTGKDRASDAAADPPISSTRDSGTAVGDGSSVPSVGQSPLGIDANRRLRDLNESERRTFCDWVAESNGGYGSKRKCPDSLVSIVSDVDLQACLKDKFGRSTSIGCTATVGDAVTCLQGSNELLCGPTPLVLPESCANVIPCSGT